MRVLKDQRNHSHKNFCSRIFRTTETIEFTFVNPINVSYKCNTLINLFTIKLFIPINSVKLCYTRHNIFIFAIV